jgi:hypothetical protein
MQACAGAGLHYFAQFLPVNCTTRDARSGANNPFGSVLSVGFRDRLLPLLLAPGSIHVFGSLQAPRTAFSPKS